MFNFTTSVNYRLFVSEACLACLFFVCLAFFLLVFSLLVFFLLVFFLLYKSSSVVQKLIDSQKRT